MRLGIVIPNDSNFDIVKYIIDNEYKDIIATFFYYDNYKDVIELLRNKQKGLDALLFSGSAPYDYALHYLNPEITWHYLNRYFGSLLKAVLQASLEGYDINKISYDYYDEFSLAEVCKNLNLKPESKYIFSYKSIKERGLNLDYYNETVFNFHYNNWKKGYISCVVTPCFGALKKLKEMNIPAFFAYPTAYVCRETINQIQTEYIAKKNQKSQIVILSIEINLPNEYSMFAKNERLFMQDRNGISSYIYALAEKLEATVVEPTYRNFLIFTTREILETMTNHLQSLDILHQVQNHFLISLCMGIGYGNTVREAKENANLGLIRAKNCGSNIAYVIYDSNNIIGPIGTNERNTDSDDMDKLDKTIQMIAEKSEVSMQNIFKIYSIMSKEGKDTFTTKDLSVSMNISRRSVDRVVNKLEIAGYLHVIGKQAAYDIGRPSRIIKINFNL